MDRIKQILEKPLALVILGGIVGCSLGLFVLGWALWPVKWTNAAPSDLQMDYQRDYLCMVIDSYIRNQDGELVTIRTEGLGENANELLDTLTPAVCRFSSDAEIAAFKEMVGISSMIGDMAVAPEVEAVMPEDEGKNISLLPLALLALLTLVAGGIFAFLMLKKKGVSKSGAKSFRDVVIPKNFNDKDYQAQEKVSKHAVPESMEPLAQFMTTYRQGDDLYDDSFSIDSTSGEFLGECGVGIAETIGVGDPKKVTALEVWLFDKNDIQTVTKVLLSEHANADAAIRQRLLSKGEPILVEPGMIFEMETATLKLKAKVIDMVYARGPLPENSYFSRLTIEVSVWGK